MSTKKLQIIGGTILQPDWDQTDVTAASYIKNKPEIPEDASDIGALSEDLLGANNGIATLDESGKLTSEQKPEYTASDVGAIAETVIGVANGVAALDANGKIPTENLTLYVASDSAPADTSVLWIDTANGLKYYNTTQSAWILVNQTVNAVWGA